MHALFWCKEEAATPETAKNAKVVNTAHLSNLSCENLSCLLNAEKRAMDSSTDPAQKRRCYEYLKVLMRERDVRRAAHELGALLKATRATNINPVLIGDDENVAL